MAESRKFNCSKNLNKSTYKYGRRRSRNLGDAIPTDLADIIDKSLPATERLKTLIELSIQNAIQVAERELSKNIDPDTSAEKSAECIHNIDSSLKKLDLYALSINGDETEVFCRPCDVLYENAVSKLDKENRQWDELIDEEKRKLAETPRTPLEINFNNEMLNLPIDCGMDYSSIFKDTYSTEKKYINKMIKLKRIKEKFSDQLKHAKRFSLYFNKKSVGYFSSLVQDNHIALMREFCQRK